MTHTHTHVHAIGSLDSRLFSSRDLGPNEREGKESGTTLKHISALLPLSERPDKSLAAVSYGYIRLQGMLAGKKSCETRDLFFFLFLCYLCLGVTGVPRGLNGAVLILAPARLT